MKGRVAPASDSHQPSAGSPAGRRRLTAERFSSQHLAISGVIFCVLFAATIGAWWYTVDRLQEERHTRFLHESQRATEQLDARLREHLGVLQGMVGLFAASKSVARDGFFTYVKQVSMLRDIPTANCRSGFTPR